MRIKSLKLSNYQVVKDVDLEDLNNFVVIAGPNGVGKTKIKDAICHIFQNSGNPPAGCSVILESTCPEEMSSWGQTITLPNSGFWSFFSLTRKKIKTKARLIQIDSFRQIESIEFQQINFNQIGDPDEELVPSEYSSKRIRDRFVDICQTLQREKLKMITDLGKEAYQQLKNSNGVESVTIAPTPDPLLKFEDIFEKLLYPKKLAPIEIDSSTIQYFDDEGHLRSFSDLSSGEREVLVLAFDILLQEPSDCVILIDEPEMHLHPELTFRLIKVLKSIGERNQYFLFTHSTDIISQSFETGVYFIRPRIKVPEGNQAIRIDLSNLTELTSIPNLRETIGMLSLGKKLLFVEGTDTSIDRNVFATMAKSSKFDLAIVPSDSCDNINNLGKICETLNKGIFGIDLYMVRDRDSITDEEVEIYTKKSNGKMIFLPYYHIENTFLYPEAINELAISMEINNKSVQEISDKLAEFAKEQINKNVVRYLANEIRFKAGNFDTTPTTLIGTNASIDEITTAFVNRKNEKVMEYSDLFTDDFINQRVSFWKQQLENSISNSWSPESRKLFYGKSLIKQIQQYVFGNMKLILWEEMVNNEGEQCKIATQDLKNILTNLN